MATFLQRARGWTTYRTYEVANEADLVNIAKPENGDQASDAAGNNVWVFSDGEWIHVDEVGAGGVVWGTISGTLSDQADLQTALDAKAELPIDLTTDVTGALPIANGGTAATTAANARTSLGVAIGSNVEAWDADLDALAALSSTGLIARTGAGTAAVRTLMAGSSKVAISNGDGVAANPTVDVTEANLSHANIGGTTAIANGGTGQTAKTAAFDALSPLTTRGDMIYRDASNNVRLAKGAAGTILNMGANDPQWSNPTTGGGIFTLGNGSGAGLNPLDATTYYMNFLLLSILNGNSTTTAPSVVSVANPPMPCALTLTGIHLAVVSGTPGSAETGTGYIRVNNTTDTTIFNNVLKWDAVTNLYSSTGLSIALAAGDFFTFKFTTPTFATNPIGTYYTATITYTIP